MLSLSLFSRVKKRHLILFFLAISWVIALGLSIRGNYGSPDENLLSSSKWKEDGPFELSPERGRFMLTYAIAENHSSQFSEKLALFGSPDVAVTKDGKFASLFAPTVSFLTLPGYIIGKNFGISQVGTFSIISLFALLNVFLIKSIAEKFKVDSFAAVIGATTFLFATPAFAYGVDLYQHHISTFIILLSLYLLIKFKGLWSRAGIFFLFSLSITVDYPNLFLMFPIVFVALFKMFNIEKIKEKVKVTIKLPLLFSAVTIIFPMIFFLWFNYVSFGNPFQLSGTLKTIRDLPQYSQEVDKEVQGTQPTLEKQKEEAKKKKTAVGFFNTRNLTNGFYLHFLSPDRGTLYFTPVMFFAIAGIYISYKKKTPYLSILISTLGANIILYSMWVDPWGGWAFGSRYLIPSYAIASIFIAFALTRFKKNTLFITLFSIAFIYSVAVNTVGAITTSANPPKIEALPLEQVSGTVQKYTYERNIDYLMTRGSKSFAYTTFTKYYLKAWQHYYLVLFIILIPSILTIIYYYFSNKDGKNNE